MVYKAGFEPDYWDILNKCGTDISLMQNRREWIIDGGYMPPITQSEKDRDILKRFMELKDISSISVVDEESKTVLTLKKTRLGCITKSENYLNFMKNNLGYIKVFNSKNT